MCESSVLAEVWRPVKGYEDAYEVSDLGRVRSLPRKVMRKNGAPQTIHGRILKPFKGDAYDHRAVGFGARGDRHYVHTLVLEAFVGPRPSPHHEACHNDGNPFNNELANLRWDTASSNQSDRLIHGTHHYGNRTHCKWGHEYTPENTDWRIRTGPRYVKPSHVRVCKTCVRNRNRNQQVSAAGAA